MLFAKPHFAAFINALYDKVLHARKTFRITTGLKRIKLTFTQNLSNANRYAYAFVR